MTDLIFTKHDPFRWRVILEEEPCIIMGASHPFAAETCEMLVLWLTSHEAASEVQNIRLATFYKNLYPQFVRWASNLRGPDVQWPENTSPFHDPTFGDNYYRFRTQETELLRHHRELTKEVAKLKIELAILQGRKISLESLDRAALEGVITQTEKESFMHRLGMETSSLEEEVDAFLRKEEGEEGKDAQGE